MLEKVFYQRIPKKPQFLIKLSKGLLKVEHGVPAEILIEDKAGDSCIYRLDSDPDMTAIMYNYIHKYSKTVMFSEV